MTHDELIKKILIKVETEMFNDTFDGYATGDSSLSRALLKVVELHKPIETRPPWGGDKYFACNVCEVGTNDGDYKLDYPCETIQAIESELL